MIDEGSNFALDKEINNGFDAIVFGEMTGAAQRELYKKRSSEGVRYSEGFIASRIVHVKSCRVTGILLC